MEKKDSAMSSSTGAIKKKREEKHRKRDPRSWDNIKKAISSMSDDEKMQYISAKYCELYDEHRILTSSVNNLQKAFGDVLKEKDREQADLTKAILAKGHLESLCRELQKQNRAIRDENLARIKEEEERRREIANNFSESLNALTNLMTESKDKSNKVKEENESMSDRLTELCAQFQARESHLEALTRQLDLQKKLYETTIKKNELTHKAEKDTWLREKTILETDLEKSEIKVKALMEKIITLEAHVDIYKKQYSEFESTMTKSNKVFTGFKEEIAKATKQSAMMEKDRDDWKNRWQSSASSLINISEQHNLLTSEYQKSEKRVRALQKLCRRIQTERMTYMQQLKDHNIELETPNVIIDEDETAYGEAAALPKTSEPLMELKKDLQKIKAEKLGAPHSAVEHDKLTAKEELLKVLKGELADLQKEVGLPPSKDFLGKKSKNLKRSSKKKLKEVEDETRHLTSTEFLPPMPSVQQVFPVSTFPDKREETPSGSGTSNNPKPMNQPESRGYSPVDSSEIDQEDSAGPSSPTPGPSSTVARCQNVQNGPLEESSSTTSDTDEGIEVPHAQVNGQLGVEVYSITSEEQRNEELAHITFQRPIGIGMGDGQRIPDAFEDSYSNSTISSDDSLRVAELRDALPEDSTSSGTLVSIHVQTDYSHGDDIPTLDIVVENMTYVRDTSSGTSIFDGRSLSFVAFDNEGSSTDAQAQTIYSVPVVGSVGTDPMPNNDTDPVISRARRDALLLTNASDLLTDNASNTGPVLIGTVSLINNDSCNNPVFINTDPLIDTDSPINNASRTEPVLIGTDSLINNSICSDPVIIGTESTLNNSSDTDLMFMCTDSLINNASRTDPVFIGTDSHINSTGRRTDLVLTSTNPLTKNTRRIDPVHTGTDPINNNTSRADLVHTGTDPINNNSRTDLVHTGTDALNNKTSRTEPVHTGTDPLNNNTSRTDLVSIGTDPVINNSSHTDLMFMCTNSINSASRTDPAFMGTEPLYIASHTDPLFNDSASRTAAMRNVGTDSIISCATLTKSPDDTATVLKVVNDGSDIVSLYHGAHDPGSSLSAAGNPEVVSKDEAIGEAEEILKNNDKTEDV